MYHLRLCMQPALTDSVFTSLDARIEEMEQVKQERETALGELREMLVSMWTSVGIGEDDENRRFFERMITSPAKLHQSTHEKVCVVQTPVKSECGSCCTSMQERHANEHALCGASTHVKHLHLAPSQLHNVA